MPFDIGPGEVILILVIALIVFGPGKLPDLGRQIGGAVREFRRMSSTATEEMHRALEIDTPPASNGHQTYAPAVQESAVAAPAIAGPAEPIVFQSATDVATTPVESVPAHDAETTEEHSHATEPIASTSVESDAALRDAAPGMVFCPKCKGGTAATNNFCGVCGTALKPSTPEPVHEDQAPSPEEPQEAVQEPAQALEQPTSLGPATTSDQQTSLEPATSSEQSKSPERS